MVLWLTTEKWWGGSIGLLLDVLKWCQLALFRNTMSLHFQGFLVNIVNSAVNVRIFIGPKLTSARVILRESKNQFLGYPKESTGISELQGAWDKDVGATRSWPLPFATHTAQLLTPPSTPPCMCLSLPFQTRSPLQHIQHPDLLPATHIMQVAHWQHIAWVAWLNPLSNTQHIEHTQHPFPPCTQYRQPGPIQYCCPISRHAGGNQKPEERGGV